MADWGGDCRSITFHCVKCDKNVERIQLWEEFETLETVLSVYCHGEEARYKFERIVDGFPKNVDCFNVEDITRPINA